VFQLSTSALDTLAATVGVPACDRAAISTGIVHLGPGAFHRAHQAAYAEDVLSLDPAWGICGVSLRSAGVRDALRDQDNLYTLALLGQSTSYRIIGSIREMLVAPEDSEAVLERLTRPSTHVVSSTITEKGYCLTPEGDLNTARDEIVHDFSNPQQPVSAPGYLCEALRRRRENGIRRQIVQALPIANHLLQVFQTDDIFHDLNLFSVAALIERRATVIDRRYNSTLPRVEKHFVHERGIECVHRRRDIKRLRSFRAFLVSNHVAHAAADSIVNYQARVFAHAARRIEARLKLFAAERAHDEKPPAFERFHRFRQRHATDDCTELHILTPGSDSSTTPITNQRTGLFWSPTALRAALPSDEITTC